MTGDGVNDVLALKDADLGISMGSGSEATKAVADLVLTDNAFSSLPTVVNEGRKVINNIERVASLFLAKTTYSVILSILIASVNGYALINWKFRGSEVFFTILIFGSFIPYQIMLYPIVIMLREMGLYGTLWGLVLVHTIFGMPILTLLFRNYFSSIPEELFKAARVDGAGFWGIYFRIMLPMSLPIFVVALILQVTGIWNDFLFGVVYTKPELYPMTVQLNNIVNSVQGVKEYNVNMAATLLTGLVPLVIYFVSGKLFVRGIAAGAVKG
jgi:glucose/mannose transport system permease protein